MRQSPSGKSKTIPATNGSTSTALPSKSHGAPGEPQKIRDKLINNNESVEHPGVMCFNLYQPPTIVHGDAKDIGTWRGHIERIYPTDHGALIVDWLAHGCSDRATRSITSCCWRAAQGISKDSILARRYKPAVGGENFRELAVAK